jgi:chromosome segregation ATPase
VQAAEQRESIVDLRPRVKDLEDDLNKRDGAIKKLEATLREREEKLGKAEAEVTRLSAEHANCEGKKSP